LRWTIAAAFERGGDLAELAAEPRLRRVISAHLISSAYDAVGLPTPSASTSRDTFRWLEAVEAANAHDVDLADQLALAAYQAGEMEIAERWIGRAGRSAVAQWLRAKLLFRVGKTAEATKILSSLVPQFPVAAGATNTPARVRLADTVSFEFGGGLKPGLQLRAELGVLNLKRGDYLHAIDALLAADYWTDAAYVAERVLTIEELKTYIDRNWPEADPSKVENLKNPPDDASKMDEEKRQEMLKVEEHRSRLRDLLARRLTRSSRRLEAAGYIKPELASDHEELMRHLQAGADETLSNDMRAQHWWRAAQITRAKGMELMGTEGHPDGAEYDGNFEAENPLEFRAASESLKVLAASDDELDRIQKSAPAPNERFHYRYQAASLAWVAAKMMPDNELQTAQVLYTAGTWLKNRDPKAADVFYKALVRRCRKLDIGKAADEQRWFPEWDGIGKPVPRVRQQIEEPQAEPESQPEPTVEPTESPQIDEKREDVQDSVRADSTP
jgi:hypothetical protein